MISKTLKKEAILSFIGRMSHVHETLKMASNFL